MTAYEVLLQKDLERSRNNPLDAYSAGLVDLARFQAQQRFVKERQAEEQRAAVEIQSARDTAALQRSREEQRSAAEIAEARDTAAFERTELSTKSAEERARIAADAQLKKEQAALKKAQTDALVTHFGKMNIPKKKGESDEEYIARAQEDLPKTLGTQLATLDKDYRSAVTRYEKLSADAAATYPERLAKAAWEHAKILLPDSPQKTFLDKLPPLQRETQMALYGDKGKLIRDTYGMGLDKARQTVFQEEPDTANKLRELRFEAQQLADELARKKSDIAYASAIPEYIRQIKTPSEIGDGPDLSRMGGTRGGSPSEIPAPGNVQRLTPYSSPLPLSSVTGTTTRTGAGAAPRAAAGAPDARTTPPPETPDEIYGGGDYGWGAGQRTPLVGTALQSVPNAGAAAAEFIGNTAPELGLNAVDLGIASANQWLGTPGYSVTERVRRSGFLDSTPARPVLPSPLGINLFPEAPPARGLPPTPAEIAAFRAERDARVGARRAGLAMGPGAASVSAPLEIAPAPTTLNRLNDEQRLTEMYANTRGIPTRNTGFNTFGSMVPPKTFDPTMVNVRSPAEIAAARAARDLRPGPITPAEAAMTEAAAASELRKRIARHPKSRMYPVAPLKDKLSTMSLMELQAIYRQLGPESKPVIDVPSEVLR